MHRHADYPDFFFFSAGTAAFPFLEIEEGIFTSAAGDYK
jgi:hypothetical protein